MLGGERDSQDSNPGSLNLESGFQLQCYTSGATSGLEGLSQREAGVCVNLRGRGNEAWSWP